MLEASLRDMFFLHTGKILKGRDKQLEYTPHALNVRDDPSGNESSAHIHRLRCQLWRRVGSKSRRQCGPNLSLILLE